MLLCQLGARFTISISLPIRIRYPYNVYFFVNNNISWVNLCGVCAHNAPARLGEGEVFKHLLNIVL